MCRKNNFNGLNYTGLTVTGLQSFDRSRGCYNNYERWCNDRQFFIYRLVRFNVLKSTYEEVNCTRRHIFINCPND